MFLLYYKNMIKTVIFDLDGTLLNTLLDLKESTNYALRQFGYPERTLEEIRYFVGNGVRKLIERAVPENCENVEECLDVFKKHYEKNMYNNTVSYNYIETMLKTLKSEGIKLGVVSNKFDLAVKELCKKYYDGLVDIAIGQGGDVLPKPSPFGVYKAMKELGADKASTIYVGDSEVDVQTAQNANIPCIGVTWGFRGRAYLDGADYIIDDPCEIINIVRGK